MHVYRLQIMPGEADGEGEDHDEWFGSLRQARARRAHLIRENPRLEDHRTQRDFRITKCYVRDLSHKALLLAALNRTAWLDGSEEVVPTYVPHERRRR